MLADFRRGLRAFQNLVARSGSAAASSSTCNPLRILERLHHIELLESLALRIISANPALPNTKYPQDPECRASARWYVREGDWRSAVSIHRVGENPPQNPRFSPVPEFPEAFPAPASAPSPAPDGHWPCHRRHKAQQDKHARCDTRCAAGRGRPSFMCVVSTSNWKSIKRFKQARFNQSAAAQ